VGEAGDVESITGAHGGETRLAAYTRQSKNLSKIGILGEVSSPRGATRRTERQANLAEKFALQLFA
jgi:hypothetical protein